MNNDIVIAGVGMVPFRKPGQSDSYDVMGEGAARAALADAGISYSLVEQALCGYVHADSGAAAVVVCTADFARGHGIRSDVVLAGRSWGSDRRQYFSGGVLDVMFQALSRDEISWRLLSTPPTLH